LSDRHFFLILFLASGLFCTLPLVLGLYSLHVVIVSLFYVMMAASWNLIAGYTGQVSFAHAAFAGIGAYTSGILAAKAGLSPWLGVAAGSLTAGAMGLGVGVSACAWGAFTFHLPPWDFQKFCELL
jgi:branched-chain amino acid transport system permease protein